jgi:DDE family transposase
MENRSQEQWMLFADRTSTAYLRRNQIRWSFSSVAYLLMQARRRLGLPGTEWAKAPCRTLRLQRLKIGALIRITGRKVGVSMAEGYPYAEALRHVDARLQAVPLRP